MLKAYSVQKLNQISKTQKIWCFGCGKRLNDILNLYREEPFTAKITALLDNNTQLWGTNKKVGSRQVPICSPDKLKSQGNRRVFLLITSDRHKEIYSQVSTILTQKGIECSRYPICYGSYVAVLQAACRSLPMRRQMLFRTGEQPSENAKAIVEYLAKKYTGKRYRLVFMVDKEENERKSRRYVIEDTFQRDTFKGNNRKENTSQGIVCIGQNTLKTRNSFGRNLRYCFYMATSKYIFYENEPLEKVRKGQILIYLNHGTIPLKNVKDVLKQPEEVDYAVCPSKGCAQIYKEQYGISEKKLLYGMPPRDDFLRRDTYALERVIDCSGRQVIIWLPTFRTLKGTDRRDSVMEGALPLLTNAEDYQKINKQLRENGQLLLIKAHPREKEALDIPASCGHIKLISDEELKKADVILQEILGDTAALITDYSGISFEYMLLGRPIGYVVNDMDSYTRGFAFENPQDYMPGTMVGTVEELLHFLDDVRAGRDECRKAREKLVERLFQGNEKKGGAQTLIQHLEDLKRQVSC